MLPKIGKQWQMKKAPCWTGRKLKLHAHLEVTTGALIDTDELKKLIL
jgi:hypothetical protein